jgi:hypothetical protein
LNRRILPIAIGDHLFEVVARSPCGIRTATAVGSGTIRIHAWIGNVHGVRELKIIIAQQGRRWNQAETPAVQVSLLGIVVGELGDDEAVLSRLHLQSHTRGTLLGLVEIQPPPLAVRVNPLRGIAEQRAVLLDPAGQVTDRDLNRVAVRTLDNQVRYVLAVVHF